MIPNAFRQLVFLCLATAALSGPAAAEAINQTVNTTTKTDRLDAETGSFKTEPANRQNQSRKTETGLKVEPTSTPGSSPSRYALINKDLPPAPVADDPNDAVEPATNSVESSRNFAEDDPAPSPVWTYSKGLFDRTEGRAKYLWNQWLNRK